MTSLLRLSINCCIWCLSSLLYGLYNCPQQHFSIENKRAIKQFFIEVEELLPKKMITRIQSKQRTITVLFIDLSNQSQHSPKHYGFFEKTTHHIYLDNSILNVLLQKKSQHYSSNLIIDHHKNAVSTLIHETTHLYDFLNLRSKQEKEHYQACQNAKTSTCRVIQKNYKRRTTLSEDLSFKKETKWPSSDPNKHNTTIISSPDAYEQENIYEYLAVNMEYFLLDSNYKKKRPSLYYFLTKHFKQDEKKKIYKIKPFTYLHPNTSEEPINIDPKYIHNIDYIIVDKGSDN